MEKYTMEYEKCSFKRIKYEPSRINYLLPIQFKNQSTIKINPSISIFLSNLLTFNFLRNILIFRNDVLLLNVFIYSIRSTL